MVILKLDGYVTKGMEGAGEKIYSYEVLYRQYIKDRVYSEDQEWMYEAISLATINKKLAENSEYVSSYRVMDRGEVHYYLSIELKHSKQGAFQYECPLLVIV